MWRVTSQNAVLGSPKVPVQQRSMRVVNASTAVIDLQSPEVKVSSVRLYAENQLFALLAKFSW